MRGTPALPGGNPRLGILHDAIDRDARAPRETHGWPSADPNFANGSVDKSLSFPFSFPSWPFADPVPDPRRIPLESPPTPSCPFADLRAPSWTFVPLRGQVFAFVFVFFLFLCLFQGIRMRAGRPRSRGDPFGRTVQIRILQKAPWISLFLFLFLPGPSRTLSRPVADPFTRIDPELRSGSPSVWPLRFYRRQAGCLQHRTRAQRQPTAYGYKGIRMRAGRPRSRGDPFGRPLQIRILQQAPWISLFLFLFLPGPSRTLSRPSADPSRSPANPFVPLRGPSCPFVDIFFLFSFSSWSFADPFPTRGGSLHSDRPGTAQWVSFGLAVEVLPPTGWLPAAPHESSAPANGIRNKDAGGTPALPGGPLWAARADPNFATGSVDKSFSFPFSSWSFADPFPTLGGSLSNPRQPLRAPSWSFVPLRG